MTTIKTAHSTYAINNIDGKTFLTSGLQEFLVEKFEPLRIGQPLVAYVRKVDIQTYQPKDELYTLRTSAIKAIV